MTKKLFSIHAGHMASSPDMTEYLYKLVRIQQGVKLLFESVELSNHIDLKRSTHGDGNEWIDVLLSEGCQLDFISVLENSLNSALTKFDIEHNIALVHAQESLHLLRELHDRRNWPSTEFLELVDSRSNSIRIALMARNFNAGDANVRLLYPDGHRSVASIPNRTFSALWDMPFDLHFLPCMVGLERAAVNLSKLSRRSIGARTRRIDASWSDPFARGTSDYLFEAAKCRTWISARCLIVANGMGSPKSLLIQEFIRDTAED